MEKLWEDFLIQKILFLTPSWFWATNFRTFVGRVGGGFDKTTYYMSKESVWGKILFVFLFWFFWTLNKKFPGPRWESFRQDCENYIVLFHEKNLRIFFENFSLILFFEFQRNVFGRPPKTFHGDCQNCIPPVQRIILRENIFCGIFFETFRDLDQIISAALYTLLRQFLS